MFKNYFKIAVRNLARNKVSSFINISGLAVGMAVAMLIGLWVWDELSFDHYHQNYPRIAQVVQKERFLGGIKVWERMPYRVAEELQANYRGNFKHIVIATSPEDRSLSAGETRITATGMSISADAPEMLTLKMLKGSRAGLKDPHAILLSASAAKGLFGNKDPMGQTVSRNNLLDATDKADIRVAGVYEDLPHNTGFHDVKFLQSWELYESQNRDYLKSMEWDDHRYLILVEIQPGADMNQVGANIRNAELSVISHLDNVKKEAAAGPELLLHPMNKWHLYSEFKDGVADRGPIQFVWLVGIIGGFVLLLACINFMNLSTARSERRAKEVGIRKVMGSLRMQLINQFLSESYLVVLLSFGLAILLVALALPWFNELSAKQLSLPLGNPWYWLVSLAFIFLTGLLAGSYPALYLSSFRPVSVLKGLFRAGRLAAIPRKVLVVAQFTVSITLIIGTIVVYNQIIFAKDRPVGYSRDGLLMVPMTSGDFYGKYNVLRIELKSTGAVAEMAESESPLTDVSSHNGGFNWKGKDPGLEEDFGTLTVTYEYGKTVGWQFLDGRDFSREYLTDSSGFVINETAAKFLGLKNPVGEMIHWENKWMNIDKSFRVLGVIKDMVMQSPFGPVKPTIFRIGGNPNWIYVKINPEMSADRAMPKIEAVFRRVIPSAAFQFNFASDEYARKFATEERIGKLAALFAILAVLISCLGLFGMASFMAEQRTKEIGVRKVLGASAFNLWRLLSTDFVRLVLISLMIAIPMAYYFMHNWLRHYQYRTALSWWIFAAAGAGAILITLVTVSYQSIGAALANPVKTLRTE